MKRILAVILAAILCTNVFGQTRQDLTGKHEINVEYGQLTMPQFVYGTAYILADIFVVLFSGGNQQLGQMHFPGALSFEYNYWIDGKWSIGASISDDFMYGQKETSDGIMTDIAFRAQSLQVIGRYSWFNNEHCGMYSKVGVGPAAVVSTDDWSIGPAFQVTPVAVDFGGKNLRGFVEAGFGTQGMILGGIRYRL